MSISERFIPTPRRKPIISPFLAGVIAAILAYSLIQDYFGKDKYIELVRISWVDWHYAWPIYIVMGIIVLIGISGSKYETY